MTTQTKTKSIIISITIMTMCVAMLFILRLQSNTPRQKNANIISIPLIAELYNFPMDSLFLVRATESAREFRRINDENAKMHKQEDKKVQPNMEIVSAYFVVPQKIATFYPLVITIFYNRRPTQEELDTQVPVEVQLEKWAKNPYRKRFVNDPEALRIINFFRPFDDRDGFKSVLHMMNNIGAPRMGEDGKYAEDNYASGTEGLAFDYYNLKKNYCVRVVHAIYLRGADGRGTDLIAIPEAPEYYKDWKEGYCFPSDPAGKHQRPNLREVLPVIAKSVMENIEETGLIEKFLAEKAAAKSQKPANPTPKP